jgi:hypothetical protein
MIRPSVIECYCVTRRACSGGQYASDLNDVEMVANRALSLSLLWDRVLTSS